MKRILFISISLFFILSIFESCSLTKPEMKVIGQVPLKTVFDKVLKQYQDADSIIEHIGIGDHHLTILEADVIFDNVISDEGSASLNLLIFKAGYSQTKRKETTVTYSLIAAPLVPEEKNGVARPNVAKQNALRDLIVNSYKQFIAVSLPPSTKITFEKNVEIDVAFTVDQSGNIEVSGPIGQLTPDASLSRDVSNTHTISIRFAIDKK